MKNKTMLALVSAAALIHSLTACASPRNGAEARGGNLAFEDFDTNSDGGISKSEFVENVPFKLRNPDRIFERLDTDGNGVIGEEEFAARRRGR